MIEYDELIRVNHVHEEEMVAFRLKESEHFGMSQRRDGQVQTPRQDPFLFRSRNQVRNVVRDKLFVEITP